MDFEHVSVLLGEAVGALMPERGGIFIDCTAGGGGHSYETARRLPEGSRLICLDRDDDALEACRIRLSEFPDRTELVKSNFADLGSVLSSLGIERIDGALWDLGVSSHQLDEGDRGFSYSLEAPLDMRMDRSQKLTAADIVNTYPEEELKRIIWLYGEERFSGRIARSIVNARQRSPISTTTELAGIITSAIPSKNRSAESQHPARRTFQALRIEVNGELDAIAPSIRTAAEMMNPGGRMAVITFHSLEDRIVKETFRELSSGCTCPPEFPVCVCGKKPVLRLVPPKPILPSEEEMERNPRSRSAKLRVAEKI